MKLSGVIWFLRLSGFSKTLKPKFGPQLLAKFLVRIISQIARNCIDNNIGFCGLLDRQTLLDEIMSTVEDLVSDSSQHVRAALGTQISGLAPILGKEEYVER